MSKRFLCTLKYKIFLTFFPLQYVCFAYKILSIIEEQTTKIYISKQGPSVYAFVFRLKKQHPDKACLPNINLMF